MTTFEIIILIITNVACVGSVWFAAKNNRLTWAFGFVEFTIMAAMFLSTHHYMSFAFNAYSALTCVWGHFRWKKDVAENDRTICWGNIYVALLMSLAIGCMLYFFNDNLSDDPWLDSIGTGLSIVAAYLLVKQDINAWILYLISDLIYIGLGIVSSDIEYTIIFAVMLVLGIYGTREFIVKYRRNQG